MDHCYTQTKSKKKNKIDRNEYENASKKKIQKLQQEGELNTFRIFVYTSIGTLYLLCIWHGIPSVIHTFHFSFYPISFVALSNHYHVLCMCSSCGCSRYTAIELRAQIRLNSSFNCMFDSTSFTALQSAVI